MKAALCCLPRKPMPHKYDIFISYGHLDDEDPGGDVKGWVDLLVERLPRLVSNNLGYLPVVWRDERSLHGNDLLTAAISEGVTTSLLLIPIVSPRYVQSDWCRRELEAFCQSEPPPGAPAFRSRIFKVIKTPLLFHLVKKEPEPLRELIGYSFYEMDGDMPVEFGPEVVPTKDPRYWTALRRLAWDVSNMLVALKHAKDATTGPLVMPTAPANPSVTATTPVGASTNGEKKYVYLAETTSDLASERELVRDELRQRGYGVLPEEKLPAAEMKQIQTTVNQALARCVLSVHLIGKRYGSTPEDNPRSLVCIQDDLSAQKAAKDANFSRLLWMPQGLMTPPLEITDERQKEFVTALQNRIGERSELLQTSIEDLKTRIVEKLNPPTKQTATKPVRSKLKQVYLICENRDRSFIRPIKEYLFKQNIEVITWLDDEAGRTLMDYHHKNLRECDAALVYFGNGDEPWVRKNLEDLEKAYGYGREQDWAASAVYVGAPASDQKEDFLTHLVPYVIRNYQSFDPNDLRDFVTAVQTSEGEQG
jgi:hypothetical protein